MKEKSLKKRIHGMLWNVAAWSRIQSELFFGSVKSHYSAVADLDLWSLICGAGTTVMCQLCVIMLRALWFYLLLNFFVCLTSLLLFVVGEFLDRASVAQAADWTGQPFSQSVSGPFRTRRAGLQWAEGWLRLKVRHRLRLSIRTAYRIVFWKK